ncbi:fumarylacetoacetate hydrolase family protein [Trueperella pecoris]|uniref:fumarylacetoacetate hydrolase family protein n=1 Tax=Trueperella pecoris TaxID=2733571 RepID=UPI00186B8DD4|nr:fumarylacetoacetate hydrolase family protein [Trueperella pecoris]QOQ38571.1 fumarylacetoacetate hydrolase family protein [Trueperella pecoris]
MKIARLSLDQGPRFAVVDEASGAYHVLADDPMYAGISPTGQIVSAEDANLVAPMLPRSKVIGFGDNYNRPDYRPDPTTVPTTFLKPNTAVVGPNVPIVAPKWSGNIIHEAELAVVISRLCKDVPVERANEVIFGYTVGNDVADGVTQKSDLQWARAKGFDTSCPVGPVIVTDLDVSDLEITLSVDGEVKGRGTTADLARSVPELIALASSMFTLLPGDIILTGAAFPSIPAGPGTEVTCAVERIGQLRNPVVSDE